MALYRKYRPATFSEVVGQEHVTEPLSTALDSGRINHAYLFSGPRGCGKTSSARILARSLNCEQGPTSTPCGVCNSCVALAPGGPGNLDVTEMDAASHGGVDDARELRDRAFYAPAESRYRVFIVDEAHMVTPQGFNALLKIVEEPPEHLIFIFATTEPEKVLTTIRSRTHHYPFRLLAPNVMRPLLEKITSAESVAVEPAVYPLVIRAGGGSPRDSLSIMDQLLAGAGPDGVTYQRALGLLGVTDTALIDSAVDALASSDGAALFGAVEQVMEAGHDPRRFATDLLERLRDLILLHTVPDAADRGLIDVPVDVLDTMRDEASKLGLATLTRCAEVTHASLAEMRGATSPRLLLEVMCARMLLPAADESQAALLQRIEALERRPGGSGPVVNGASASAPEQGSAPQGAAPQSSAGDAAPKFVRASQRQAEPEAPVEAAPPASEPAQPTAPAPSRVEGPASAEPAAAREASPAEPTPAAPVEPAPSVVPPQQAAPSSQPQDGVESAPVLHRPDRQAPASDHAPEAPPQPVDAGEAQPPAASAPPAQEPKSAPAASAPEPQTGPTIDDVRTGWPKVLRAVSSRSKVTATLMTNMQVLGLAGDTLHLALPIPALLGRFGDPQHVGNLRDAVREIFGTTWNVEVGDGAGAPQQVAPQQQRPPVEQKKAPPTFERRSRNAEQRPDPRPAGRENREPSHHDDIPLPPEPEPEPEPEQIVEVSEEEMMADAERDDAAAGGASAPRRDPNEVALELLKNELGARPI